MAESVALKGMPKEKKLEYLLDITYTILSEVGSNNITLDLIAEQASVSKGTLSYYFHNKEELIIQCLKRLARRYVETVLVGKQDGDDSRQQLLNVVEALWHLYLREPTVMIVYYDLWSHGFYNNQYRKATSDIYLEYRTIFEEPVRGILCEKNDQSEAHVQVHVSLVAGLIKGVAQEFILSPESVDANRMLEGLKNSVLKVCGYNPEQSSPYPS
jgi:AcrR family transcriptional regulator